MGHSTQPLVIDTSIKAHPYGIYARMRHETPVCKVLYGSSRSPVWMVTRYDDVATVLKDPRFSNHRQNAEGQKTTLRFKVFYSAFAPLLNNMLNRDQPDHTRLRGLVHKAFTPKRVEDLRRRVESLTEELLVPLKGRTTWDLVANYATPIPTTIIAEMLGVPSADRDKFQRWSNALLLGSATTFKGMASNLPKFAAFQRYIRGLINERRRRAQDDLISALVAAEEAGDKLTQDELVAMVFLLLIAGYETTMNLIGNGTLALLENPAEMDKLRAHPELLASAIEEFVRYYTPVDYGTARFAVEDVTIAGETIPRGSTVIPAISAANRDERQFEQAEVLNVAREPNRHLGFGQGIHYCLGAPLARLEAQIAFKALLEHFDEIRLAVPRERLKWRASTLLRGVESLPVETVAVGKALRSSA